jgi:lipopolysaccharide export LptBFGC system permease protein LptF
MQRFDRYLLRVFLSWWLVVGATLCGLFTALKLLGKSDEIQQAESFGLDTSDLLRYALLEQPFQLLLFGHYITLLAALGTITQLLKHREWVPVLVSGRSVLRAMAPVLLAALGLALALSWARESAVPRFLAEHESLDRRFFSQVIWSPSDLWVRGPGDSRLHAGRFVPAASGGPRIEELQIFLRGPAGDEMLEASAASWNGSVWELTDGRLRSVRGDELRASFALDGLGPADCERAWFARVRPLDLSVADCAALLAGDPGHRQAATLAWSWRLAPFVPVLLILLSLPFVLRFERKTSWEGLAGGLALCGVYFVVELVLRDLGGRGALSPFWAGAGPVALFGGLAMIGLGRTGT